MTFIDIEKVSYETKLRSIKKARIAKVLDMYNNKEKGGEVVPSLLEAYKVFLVDTNNKAFLSKLKDELKEIKSYMKYFDNCDIGEYSYKLLQKKKKNMNPTTLYCLLRTLLLTDKYLSSPYYHTRYYKNAITRIFNISVDSFLEYKNYYLYVDSCYDITDLTSLEDHLKEFGFDYVSEIEEFKKDLALRLAQKELGEDNSKDDAIKNKIVQNKISQKD